MKEALESMKTRNKYVIISGGSGVGKTTLLEKLLRKRASGELSFALPLKVSTRDSRVADNPEEIRCISGKEFMSHVRDGDFIMEYKRHGHKFGVLRPTTDEQIVVLVVPAREIGNLMGPKIKREDLSVILLQADPRVIGSRLDKREDDISASETTSRRKTARNKPLGITDYVVDAELPVEEVSNAVSRIISSVSTGKPPLDNLQRPDLVVELKVVRAISDAAEKSGISVMIFGGLAANIYGSDRAITDVDVLANSTDFGWLKRGFDHPELQFLKNKALIGHVEVGLSPSRVGKRSEGQTWKFDREALHRSNVIAINGTKFRVISVEDLLVMKSALARGVDEGKFDLIDVENIVRQTPRANIDMAYISSRAKRSNVIEPVCTNLISAGLDISRRDFPGLSH